MFSTLRILRWASLGAVIALLGSSQSIATAQSGLGDTSGGDFQSNELDTFGGSSFQNFDPIDLYHQVNFQKKSLDVFNEESQDNLNNAADEFKRQQRQLLEESVTPTEGEAIE